MHRALSVISALLMTVALVAACSATASPPTRVDPTPQVTTSTRTAAVGGFSRTGLGPSLPGDVEDRKRAS